MARMTIEQRAEWERTRDLDAELQAVLDDARVVRPARKTEFLPLSHGRMRRRVTRADGTVEHDQIIPAAQVQVAAARAGTGLSQAEFAALMGVSVRTLQDWEAGRRNPSGAAKTLLRIASVHPDIVREAVA